jgi:hypothetical protein
MLGGICRNKYCVELAADYFGRPYGKVMRTGKPTLGIIAGEVDQFHDAFHGHADAIASLRPSDVRTVRSADPGHLMARHPVNRICVLLRRVGCLHVSERDRRLQEYVDWVASWFF